MKILMTNDDGFDAPGIRALYREISTAGHDVTLVAPDREKSAVGHGITLNSPLRLNPVEYSMGKQGYITNGTPADCVKLGLYEFYDTPPDLILSGINPGSNTGVNTHYSGTVAAAREGAMNSVLSISVSLELSENRCLDFSGMARFIAQFIQKLEPGYFGTPAFLNINAPDMPIAETKGIKITKQTCENISEDFEKRTDPKGRCYFWYGRVNMPDGEPESDIRALADGYISITPMRFDATDLKHFKDLLKLQKGPFML